jgi:hypothetical protein
MSNFYASIQGHRGQATRQGHKHINGHIRGWHVGVRVVGRKDEKTGKNTFVVYKTGGSSGHKSDELITKIEE